jgi:alanine dehydrogenase
VAVLVQAGAGAGSSIADDGYRAAGAEIVADAAEVWGRADLVCKVKEPQDHELAHLREGLVLFTYLHLAAYPEVADALLARMVIGIGYETVQLPSGALPLLAPMSEVAGRMAPQIGAHWLERAHGGRGILLENLDRLRWVDQIHQGRIMTLASNRGSVARAVGDADLVIGAVLVPGAAAPVVVSRAMVAAMRPGAVIVDVAVDQGGCVETTHETSHHDPVYEMDGVVHYAVGNIPGAVPHTSTYALTNATLPYLVELAARGVEPAVRADPALALGVNTLGGHVVNPVVAEALGRPFVPLDELW